MMYLPYYNPVSIWGPPLYYPYASWYYPPFIGGAYFGFGLGINMGFYFGGGWGGWGGWGWRPGWGNHSVIVNNSFIHRNNFNTGASRSLSGNTAWSHDSSHREGVPYSNAAVSNRYGGAVRQNLQSRASLPCGTGAISCGCGTAAICEAAALPHRERNEWAIVRLRPAPRARTGARSAAFRTAARRGRIATTDIRASDQRGAEALRAEHPAEAAVAATLAVAAATVVVADTDSSERKPWQA